MRGSEIRKGQVLGNRAVWGSVGYTGKEFAPAPGSYELLGRDPAAFATTEDSGARPDGRAALTNLAPLIAAAIYEIGFAWELGPLSTWSN